MVSRKVLLTSRWGYYLQIDEQQNICGARTKDDYCGKIKKKLYYTLARVHLVNLKPF